MLYETVYQKKCVGLISKGFYYIRTTQAVWSRVQVVERSRYYVRIFYTITQRSRRRQGKGMTRRCVERLPIATIVEARRYNT